MSKGHKGNPSSGRSSSQAPSSMEHDLREAFMDLGFEEGMGNPLDERELSEYVEEIPSLTPLQISEQLAEHGYVGQEKPRRSMSLMAFRHVQRLRYIHLDKVPVEELPPKSNHLLVGPTGCGKTYMVETLFRHILDLPTVLVDITTYSETGYVGQDVTSILTRLLYAADGDVGRAEMGIVCLDEFDKIASGQNNAVFAGAGTTKDISGLGVQRELLKLLESTTVTVPTEFSHSSYQQHLLMSTTNIPFVACGAFSGLKLVTHLFNKEPHIGFTAKTASQAPREIAVSFRQEEMDQTRNFQQYGFLPELIARFDRVIPFRALDEETLMMILRQNLLSSYKREFELAGVDLVVDKSVLERVVKQALKRETGARGLRSTLAYMLEDAAFEIYSEPGLKRVEVAYKNGEVFVKTDG